MILITGAAGYLGSHLALIFSETNRNIIAFDSFETVSPEQTKVLKNFSNIQFIEGSLINKNDINSVFEKYNISSVIHLAGLSPQEEGISSPSKYYTYNLFATLNLLDSMLKNNIKNLIFSSSCQIYGELLYQPVDEIHPQIPLNTFARTKMIVEKILDDYDKAYNLKSVRLRYYNQIGGFNQKMLELELEQNLFNTNFNKSILLCKATEQVNEDEFINIEDLANAHFLALNYLERENISNAFNLGCDDTYDNKQTKTLLKKLLQKSTKKVNIKKAKTLLGWQPFFNLEKTLTLTNKQILEVELKKANCINSYHL